jgi:hypothetical protein
MFRRSYHIVLTYSVEVVYYVLGVVVVHIYYIYYRVVILRGDSVVISIGIRRCVRIFWQLRVLLFYSIKHVVPVVHSIAAHF